MTDSDSEAHNKGYAIPEELLRIEEFRASGELYGRSLFAGWMLSRGAGAVAWTAHRHRVAMINLPQMGPWFRALDELFAALGLFHAGFRVSDQLREIAFLIERAVRDFQAGIDLALSGLRAAAFDTMRDTMEIDYLLNDFLHEPSNIQKWLSASTRKEEGEFSPAALRKREAKRQGIKEDELQTKEDYGIHSKALHVTPAYHLTAMRGVHEFDETFSLFPFYELFYHGGSLLETLAQYARRLDQESVEKITNLSMERFSTAWREIRQEVDRMRSSLDT